MENFSTVLWIVVIAAAMIFNVVSQLSLIHISEPTRP